MDFVSRNIKGIYLNLAQPTLKVARSEPIQIKHEFTCYVQSGLPSGVDQTREQYSKPSVDQARELYSKPSVTFLLLLE